MDIQLRPKVSFKDYYYKVLKHQKILSEKRMKSLMKWNWTIGIVDNYEWKKNYTCRDFNFDYSDEYTSTPPNEENENFIESENECEQYYTSESEEESEYSD